MSWMCYVKPAGVAMVYIPGFSNQGILEVKIWDNHMQCWNMLLLMQLVEHLNAWKSNDAC